MWILFFLFLFAVLIEIQNLNNTWSTGSDADFILIVVFCHLAVSGTKSDTSWKYSTPPRHPSSDRRTELGPPKPIDHSAVERLYTTSGSSSRYSSVFFQLWCTNGALHSSSSLIASWWWRSTRVKLGSPWNSFCLCLNSGMILYFGWGENLLNLIPFSDFYSSISLFLFLVSFHFVFVLLLSGWFYNWDFLSLSWKRWSLIILRVDWPQALIWFW